MGIPEQIPADIRSEDPSLWIVSRQEFRPCRASPSHLASKAGNHPCGSFSRATDLQFRLPPIKLAVQERYKQKKRLGVSSCSLQGIAERPLPCNYNVIQPVSALSRR